ncbi:glycosyltransferase [Synechococcus sp. CS-1324]|uniref:glycosyltransferase n=1 Tax=Synechococcus sp. CS-1324 TaxID=2847980 RepID=UPI000DB23F4D|nr:glycosyltransferase [Synechococcus sp. CS-1324]MCT0229485.1 glycosyltransferase [Synechococcus sp. CS-1324]PZV04869.1 MAG: glycosyltransferase family 4 protein [Cyanobium sp.]
MNILLIADPHIPVPPTQYGGTERIADLYARELNRLGHRISLMAGIGSRDYGGGLHVHRAPTMAYHSRARRKLQFQIQSLWAARNVDWIFNHGRFDYLETLLRTGIPIVHIAQNPLDGDQIKFMERRVRSNFLLCVVSNDQLKDAPTSLPTKTIHNFVDTRHFRFSNKGDGYLAFLGRLTDNKGVHTAIEVAKLTNRQLRIAGTISTEEGGEEYFYQRVKPEIDGDLIQYVGPVDDTQKQALLCGADALLFPTQWREPCAIVISESLACGTPVLAFDVASNGELIDNRVTGILCPTVGDATQMAEAVGRINQISRMDCRKAAETRFDVRSATRQLINSLPARIL